MGRELAADGGAARAASLRASAMLFADAGSIGLARFVALISPPETLLRRRYFSSNGLYS
jgi:hypothetical protein